MSSTSSADSNASEGGSPDPAGLQLLPSEKALRQLVTEVCMHPLEGSTGMAQAGWPTHADLTTHAVGMALLHDPRTLLWAARHGYLKLFVSDDFTFCHELIKRGYLEVLKILFESPIPNSHDSAELLQLPMLADLYDQAEIAAWLRQRKPWCTCRASDADCTCVEIDRRPEIEDLVLDAIWRQDIDEIRRILVGRDLGELVRSLTQRGDTQEAHWLIRWRHRLT
jgi:hypothetical protein